MFERFSLFISNVPSASSAFLDQIELLAFKNSSFFTLVEKWRNLETSYISRLSQLKSDCLDQSRNHQNIITSQLSVFFQLLISHHKQLINKINYDIFLSNIQFCKPIIKEQQQNVQKQKNLCKQLTVKKQQFEKVINKREKLRKQIEEQQILHVLYDDSYEESAEKKKKREGKLKEIIKQKDASEIKVRENKQKIMKIMEESRVNIYRFNEITSTLKMQASDIVMKLYLHTQNCSKCLSLDLQQKSSQLSCQTLNTFECPIISNQYIRQQKQVIKKMDPECVGYLDNCLQSIINKKIDKLSEYSKDSEIKKKIKRIMDQSEESGMSKEDEIYKQIRLTIKILEGENNQQLFSEFVEIIKKDSRFRMNFIIMLQFNRLKNKFEISENVVKPLISLIQHLIQTSDKQKDAYILKNIMVLLSTYYTSMPHELTNNKVYLVNFFKNNPIWRNIELWESILIQCIYIQKKTTLRMLLITSANSSRSDLIDAERTSILNQILYVVRNMLLFDFTERQVKDFGTRFVKLLKQDQKFLRNVYKSIQNAIEEQKEILISKEASQKMVQIAKGIPNNIELPGLDKQEYNNEKAFQDKQQNNNEKMTENNSIQAQEKEKQQKHQEIKEKVEPLANNYLQGQNKQQDKNKDTSNHQEVSDKKKQQKDKEKQLENEEKIEQIINNNDPQSDKNDE